MKLKPIWLIGAAAVFFTTMPAQAQSPSPTSWQERFQNRQEIRQEKREQRVERRCDLVNGRIDARINRYREHYDEVEARLARIAERGNQFIARLEAKGYDVSQVKEDLTALTAMRTTRRNLYSDFIAKLEAAKQYDCGDSQGAFKDALTEARAALAKWREQVKTIHDFMQNTLRPHLKALRGQNPSPAPAAK
jgi:GTP1/Obg family GTP-binding protein